MKSLNDILESILLRGPLKEGIPDIDLDVDERGMVGLMMGNWIKHALTKKWQDANKELHDIIKDCKCVRTEPTMLVRNAKTNVVIEIFNAYDGYPTVRFITAGRGQIGSQIKIRWSGVNVTGRVVPGFYNNIRITNGNTGTGLEHYIMPKDTYELLVDAVRGIKECEGATPANTVGAGNPLPPAEGGIGSGDTFDHQGRKRYMKRKTKKVRDGEELQDFKHALEP